MNLKRISYETVPINLLKDEQAGEAYAAVNPQKRVPALDVGGTVLIQSLILEYLDEVHPELAAPADGSAPTGPGTGSRLDHRVRYPSSEQSRASPLP